MSASCRHLSFTKLRESNFLIAALQLAFYQLTTIVTESTLTVRYGVGLLAFRFPLSEITQITERSVPWYAGYGIRWVGDAWLFNVSGNDAIEVTFASGRKVWVGTDDPDGLAAILRLRMDELRRNAVDVDNDVASQTDDTAEPLDPEPDETTNTDVNDDSVTPDVSVDEDSPTDSK